MSVFIPEHIKNLQPYKPGNKLKTSIQDDKSVITDFINLASNENPLGASPLAIGALKDTAKFLSLYPDTGSTELVDFLSENLGRTGNQIICGHGSDSLIADIIKSFSDSKDEILTSAGSFIGYYVNINKLGRTCVAVPLKNYGYDLEGILKAITDKTRIIFLANPNNPTGTMFTVREFEMFMKKVPEDSVRFTDYCYNKRILVRQLSGFGINNGVRISTGTHTQMDYALDIFTKAFKELNLIS